MPVEDGECSLRSVVGGGTHLRSRRWPRRVAALVSSVLLLGAAAWWVGPGALLAGWEALTPSTLGAALVLGLVATSAQAVRWRLLARQRGIDVGFWRALADCYASSFANMVLPGGLVGDAARVAVYRHHGTRAWVSPLLALGAERLSATTVVFAAGSWAVLRYSVPLAAVSGVVALVCLAASMWCMRGLGAARCVAVWAAAVLGVASLAVLYLVAMASLGGPIVPVLAAVALASMSIPLGVGGWGIRELSVGILSPTLAVSSGHAVATATAYGLLATISCLPGLAVAMLSRGARRTGPDHPGRPGPSTPEGDGSPTAVNTDAVGKTRVGDGLRRDP